MAAKKKVASKAKKKSVPRKRGVVAERFVEVPVVLRVSVPADLDDQEAVEGALGFVESCGLTIDGVAVDHQLISPFAVPS
jgi:hypothetical protein